VELQRVAEALPVEVECHVLSGEVTATVMERVEQAGADLLVIGRGEERSLLGRFRSQAQSMIRASPCAVFSV